MAWLHWLESTPFSVWLKESPSLWAYPLVLFLHTIGLAFVVGPSTMIDLRLLGVGRRLPVAPFDCFFTVIWLGFWVSAVSGAMMLASDATAKLQNPLFDVKMLCVFAAVAVTLVLRRRVVRAVPIDAEPAAAGKVLALASLACWFGAITAGRFMAYL